MKAERYDDGSCRFTIETVIPAATEEREGITVEVSPATTAVEAEWQFGTPPKGYKGTLTAWYEQCKREASLLANPSTEPKVVATEDVKIDKATRTAV